MSSRTPPISGPAALPTPAAPRMRPPASPAFSAGRAAKVMPRIAGHIRAPPIPISTRAVISHCSLGATAPASDIAAKIACADEEDPPTPEQVCQAPAGDDQYSEGERVGVHDPLGRIDGDVEVVLDRGNDDVDRREVVGDDEDGDRHRDEREPGTAVDLLLLGHRAGTLYTVSAALIWPHGGLLPGPLRRDRSRISGPSLHAALLGWQRRRVHPAGPDSELQVVAGAGARAARARRAGPGPCLRHRRDRRRRPRRRDRAAGALARSAAVAGRQGPDRGRRRYVPRDCAGLRGPRPRSCSRAARGTRASATPRSCATTTTSPTTSSSSSWTRR